MKQIIAGMASGVAQTVVGQPLDMIKVQIQTYSLTFIQTIKHLYKSDGIMSFFKGMKPLLVGNSLMTATQFFVYQFCKKKLRPDTDLPPLTINFVSGSICGFVNGLILGPLQHIKIRLQINNKYLNSIQVIKSLYSQAGIKGIFKGTELAVIKQVYGVGAFFLCYQFCLRKMNPNTKVKNQFSKISYLLAGGFAGAFYWLLTYPLDALKTMVQGDQVTKATKTSKLLWNNTNIKNLTNLYRGFKIPILRSLPVNSTNMLVYQITLLKLHKLQSH